MHLPLPPFRLAIVPVRRAGCERLTRVNGSVYQAAAARPLATFLTSALGIASRFTRAHRRTHGRRQIFAAFQVIAASMGSPAMQRRGVMTGESMCGRRGGITHRFTHPTPLPISITPIMMKGTNIDMPTGTDPSAPCADGAHGAATMRTV